MTTTDHEIRSQVDRVLRNELTVDAFDEWFTLTTWDQESDFALDIEAALAEPGDENQILARLRRLVGDTTIDVYIETGASTSDLVRYTVESTRSTTLTLTA